MIRPSALLIDMDGLLIDSEPFWRASQREVLGSLGVPLTEEMMRMTMGWRIDRVVRHWLVHFNLDMNQEESAVLNIVHGVADGVRAKGKLLPGVCQSLEAGREAGLPMVLASSSPLLLIENLVEHFELRGHFQQVFSAEFESYGKPHPAVFIRAAAGLGLECSACWVIEDSMTGVVAAKAATATCIAVPDAENRSDPRFALADTVLGSLSEFPALLGEALGR